MKWGDYFQETAVLNTFRLPPALPERCGAWGSDDEIAVQAYLIHSHPSANELSLVTLI